MVETGGLELALREMSQAKMDMGILKEEKLPNGVYTRRSTGYIVVTMDAPNRHHGGVAVFYRPSPRYAVEAVQQFGTKVVGFHLETGEC